MTDEITTAELAAHEAEQAEIEADELALLHGDVALSAMAKSLDALESVREFAHTDLQVVDTESAIRWLPGAEGIMRCGERASWVAKQGEGKTQAAVQFAAQVCKAGGRVMYLDVENDAREMAERLKPLALDDEALGRFTYVNDLTKIKALHEKEDIARVWTRALVPAVSLLIYDSLTRILASFEYDENLNTDIAEWMAAVVDPIRQAGVSVLILDNTGHDESHARGAINKTALIETSFTVSGGKNVSEMEHGTLHLKCTRSRSGKIAKHVAAESGGGDYGPLVAQDGDAPEKKQIAIMEDRRRYIAEWLAEHPDEDFDEPAISKKTGKTRNTTKGDMKALVDDGLAEATGNGWKAGRANGSVNLPALREPGLTDTLTAGVNSSSGSRLDKLTVD